MPVIHLTTVIHAPVEQVFDLARDIDLHKKSMQHTGEEAVAGITSGRINCNETVTWKARHIGKIRTLKVKITDMQPPTYFEDMMLEGDFKLMRHQHHFKPISNGTIMIDILEFESPFGFIGHLFNRLYLTRYMKRLIEQRNLIIKTTAEKEYPVA
jgi:ligand-binding SRPBCC domain-containing protein